MEALRIFQKAAAINWAYDEKADVLYLSIGEPRPAVGMDVGEGIIVRYDEARKEVVGLTPPGPAREGVKGTAIGRKEVARPSILQST